MVRKSYGAQVDDGLMQPLAMIVATVGGRCFWRREPQPRDPLQANCHAQGKQLIRAQEYQQQWQEAEEGKAPARDLELEALVAVLDGSVPLLVTA